MSGEDIILTLCVYGVPFVFLALLIAAVGAVLRRVRPDLYSSDDDDNENKE